MSIEIWKDVIGFEDYYQVSNSGYIRSKDRYVRHYKGGLSLLKGRLLSPNRCRGYLVVNLFNDDIVERWGVHVLVAIHFVPNPECKPTVNHKNTIKIDNRWDNLEWATHSEQQIHAVANGLRENTLGEKSNLSKLKTNEILEIRRLYNSGNFFQREIAEIYGISKKHCNEIIKMKTWKHITDDTI